MNAINIKKDNLTDNQLVVLAQEKNESAVEELMNRYKYIPAAIARRYFLISGAYDDLLQEGMIGLYRAINTFNIGKASFRTYVYTCVKNSILSLVKKYNTKKNVLFNEYLSLSGYVDGDIEKNDIIIDGRFEPEKTYINNESEYELICAIKKVLSKNEYDIFTLFIQGYSYNDIGEKVNKSTKSVDNSIQRLKRKILQLINKKEQG